MLPQFIKAIKNVTEDEGVAVELPTKMGQPVDCDGGLCRREDERGDRVEGEDRERRQKTGMGRRRREGGKMAARNTRD